MGQHRWVFIAVFGVVADDLPKRETTITNENLLTMDGPGCLNCELPYSAALDATPCDAPPYEIKPTQHTIIDARRSH